MQSDWHRYNLKRRVASLPPLTSEIFAEKVLANKASAAATAARASFQKRCDICDRAYFSEGAYVNHLGSQRHRTLLARKSESIHDVHGEIASMSGSTFSLGEPVDAVSTQDGEDDVDDDDERTGNVVDLTQDLSGVKSDKSSPAKHVDHDLKNGLGKGDIKSVEAEDDVEEEQDYTADLSRCLFCNHESSDLESNTLHMNKNHGFFIPESDYLADLPGLITYLSETIQVLHECLYCHKHTQSSVSAQTHMRDRGHCMMAYTTEDDQLDVGDFYDFRSTYSDDESPGQEGDAVQNIGLGARRAVVTTVSGQDGDVDIADASDEDDWESDTSSTTVDDQTPVVQQKKGLGDHGNGEIDVHGSNAAYVDEYELHLPSGRTAGHRSLRQYYRQNLRNHPAAETERQARLLTGSSSDSAQARNDSDDTESAHRGRQLVTRENGGLGMIGVSEAKRREVRVAEKRQEKRAQRATAQYEWGKNRRANNQRHFRDHLLQ